MEKYEFFNCENGIVLIGNIELDLSDLINEMIYKKTTNKPLIFTLDEKHDFYLGYFAISGVNDNITSCNGEGYILEK